MPPQDADGQLQRFPSSTYGLGFGMGLGLGLGLGLSLN
jgi:hypothetical protein